MPVEFDISMEVEGRDGSCTESVKTVSGDLVCVCVCVWGGLIPPLVVVPVLLVAITMWCLAVVKGHMLYIHSLCANEKYLLPLTCRSTCTTLVC